MCLTFDHRPKVERRIQYTVQKNQGGFNALENNLQERRSDAVFFTVGPEYEKIRIHNTFKEGSRCSLPCKLG